MSQRIIRVILILILVLISRSADAVVDFEMKPDGSVPRDNTRLRDAYVVDQATSIRFFFDRNGNNSFDPGYDLSPIFEHSGQRAGDLFRGFKGSDGDDVPDGGLESRLGGQLGDFFIRQPPEDSWGQDMYPFVVDYDTSLPIVGLAGEIWDIDGGGSENRSEKWQVDVLDSAGNILAMKESPEGIMQSANAKWDGKPWRFEFTDLPNGVDKVRLTFVGTKPANIGLAFNNFSPFTADASTFIDLDPRGSYLHPQRSGRTDDEPEEALAIDLENGLPFRVEPGDVLKITRHGEFDYNVNDNVRKTIDGVWGVFASNGKLRKPILNAEPGIDSPRVAAIPVADGVFSLTPTSELAEDFSIDNSTGVIGGTLVRVPEGASHLFLSSEDSFWADNEYPPEIRFGVTISKPGVDSTGDLNNDFSIDVADINLLNEMIRAGTNDSEFDLNLDGVVDDADRSIWVHKIRMTHYGDANLDGRFDSGDLVNVFKAGTYDRDVNADWAQGDWTGDQRFGTSDLVAAFQDGGYERASQMVAVVPEPSSFVLLVAACFAIIHRKKPQS